MVKYWNYAIKYTFIRTEHIKTKTLVIVLYEEILASKIVLCPQFPVVSVTVRS